MSDADSELGLVTRQIGRPPRKPWRVAVRCPWGRPCVIASPPVLEDGSRFPTLFWLTCPHLIDGVGALESAGEAETWATRAEKDPALAVGLEQADRVLREQRLREGAGSDPCADVGLAGQRDPLGVKCLHAHVALALAGIADPVGESSIIEVGYPCDDERCARLERA